MKNNQYSQFLPPVNRNFRVDTNIANTVDEVFQPGSRDILSGWIGDKTSWMLPNDIYINEPIISRTNKQLNPSVVSMNNTTALVAPYDDALLRLNYQGALIEDENRLFTYQSYSWCPSINPDMLLNFQQYYWDRNGPPVFVISIPRFTYIQETLTNEFSAPEALESVVVETVVLVDGNSVEHSYNGSKVVLNTIPEIGSKVVVFTNGNFAQNIIGKETFEFNGTKLTTGMRVIILDNTVSDLWDFEGWDLNGKDQWDYPKGKHVQLVENVGRSIYLLDWSKFLIPETPEYIVSERWSLDENPWTTINGWFHKDCWKHANLEPEFTNRAKRPILQHDACVRLWDYGTQHRPAVQAVWNRPTMSIDETLSNQAPNTKGVNGRSLKDGDRILVINDLDQNLINKIFAYRFVDGKSVLILQEDREFSLGEPDYGDIVKIDIEDHYCNWDEAHWDLDPSMNANQNIQWDVPYFWSKRNVFGCSELWFDGTTWQAAQDKINANQEILFWLYDCDGNSLSDQGVYPQSNFVGSKIFSWKIDNTNSIDKILNVRLALNEENQIIFENYQKTQTYQSKFGDIIGDYWVNYFNENRFSDQYHFGEKIYQKLNQDGSYELPKSLTNNSLNEYVLEISRGELFEQFSSIIENQNSFEGNSLSSNNWRDTKRDKTKGVHILQHDVPLWRTELFTKSNQWNIVDAIDFVNREYIRYKNKFIQKISELARIGTIDTQDNPKNICLAILDNLSLNKNNEYPFFASKMAGSTYYIPSTPMHLGVLQPFNPQIITDNSYNPAKQWLQGHDGSLNQLFNDYRDNIILEFEKLIYDNILENYRNQLPVVQTKKLKEGFFRKPITNDNYELGKLYLRNQTFVYNNKTYFVIIEFTAFNFDLDKDNYIELSNCEYSIKEYNQLLLPYFTKFTTLKQLRWREQQFEEGNPWTYNYYNSVYFNGELADGSWRAIYNYLFDTDRPHLTPWEMLGFNNQPDWWFNRYGNAPYSSENVLLWNDLSKGFVADPNNSYYDQSFIRPGLIDIIPVNEFGQLIDPIEAGIINQLSIISDRNKNWSFGDRSPAETAFYYSEYFSFAASAVLYLMKPSQFVERFWSRNLEKIVHDDHIVQTNTLTRLNPKNVEFHTETNTVYGIAQWFSDYIIGQGAKTNSFENYIKNATVKLTWKTSGFADKKYLDFNSDFSGILSKNDFSVLFYESPPFAQHTSSAVIVEKSNNGFVVLGYDSIAPWFNCLEHIPTGMKKTISINDREIPVVVKWRARTDYKTDIIVEYNGLTYRCNRIHQSKDFFEQKYWDITSVDRGDLNASVEVPLEFTLEVKQIDYGTEFSNIQEVANFLAEYQAYLEQDGWIFENINEITGMVDNFDQSIKEFLFWNQTPWAIGNFIALNPFANLVQFNQDFGQIGNIYERFRGVSNLLNKTGNNVVNSDSTIDRIDGEIFVRTNSNSCSFVRLFRTALEHIVVFENTTNLSDNLYVPLLGTRIPRLRVTGWRTTNWQGRLNNPGFMISSLGVQPSFEMIVEDMRNIYSIEFPGDQTMQDYARHNLGYEPRQYLTNLRLNRESQFEFYLGMIQSKGTASVFERLKRSTFISQNDDLGFLEEWAFRTGEFGQLDNRENLVIELNAHSIVTNSQLIKFINEDGIDQLGDNTIEIYNNSSNWINRPNRKIDLTNRKSIFKTTGPVKLTEVKYSAFDFNDFSNLIVEEQIYSLEEKDKILLYNENFKTSAFRVTQLGAEENSILSISEEGIVEFSRPHELTSDAWLFFNLNPLNSTEFYGVYQVKIVDTLRVELIDNPGISGTFEETAIVFKFVNISQGLIDYNIDFSENEIVYSEENAYQFINGSFQLLRTTEDFPDNRLILASQLCDVENKTEDFKRFVYPKLTNDFIAWDVLDGLIPGSPLLVLDFTTSKDPINNLEFNQDNLGKTWWDTSTAYFINYKIDKNDLIYTRDNWSKLAPRSKIDIYVYISSDVTPDAYNGEVKSVEEFKTFEETLTNGNRVTRYAYWVKQNNFILKNNQTIEQLINNIINPIDEGFNLIAWTNPNIVLLTNLQQFNQTTRLQLNYRETKQQNNHHKEYVCVKRNDSQNAIPKFLWKKMVDSLCGQNSLGEPTPQIGLIHNLGNNIRPNQTWFKNRNLAAENIFKFINYTLSLINLNDEFPDAYQQLTALDNEPEYSFKIGTGYDKIELPLAKYQNYEYSKIYSNTNEIDLNDLTENERILIDTRSINNSYSVKIKKSDKLILAKNYDYVVDDRLSRNEIANTLSIGNRVLVAVDENYNNVSTLWTFDPNSTYADNFGFVFLRYARNHKTDFVTLKNWYAVDPNEPPVVVYPDIQSRTSAEAQFQNNQQLNFVKINDDGTGNWIWQKKIDNKWQTVAKQNGTVEFSEKLWKNNNLIFNGINENDFVENFVNRNPAYEIRDFFEILRTEIFSRQQENQTFFAAVNYVLAEQDNPDWLFKTSFMSVNGFKERMWASPIKMQNHWDDLLSYIEETKPYHVKLRDVKRKLSPDRDDSFWWLSDFDNSPRLIDGKVKILNPYNQEDQITINETRAGRDYYDVYDRVNRDRNNYDANTYNPVRKIKMKMRLDRVTTKYKGWDTFSWNNSSAFDSENQQTVTTNTTELIDSSYGNQPFDNIPYNGYNKNSSRWVDQLGAVGRILKYYNPRLNQNKNIQDLMSIKNVQTITGGNFVAVNYDIRELTWDNENLETTHSLLIWGVKKQSETNQTYTLPQVYNQKNIQVYFEKTGNIGFDRLINGKDYVVNNDQVVTNLNNNNGTIAILIVGNDLIDLKLSGGELARGFKYVADLAQTVFSIDADFDFDETNTRVFVNKHEVFYGSKANQYLFDNLKQNVVLIQPTNRLDEVIILITKPKMPWDIDVNGGNFIFSDDRCEERANVIIYDPLKIITTRKNSRGVSQIKSNLVEYNNNSVLSTEIFPFWVDSWINGVKDRNFVLNQLNYSVSNNLWLNELVEISTRSMSGNPVEPDKILFGEISTNQIVFDYDLTDVYHIRVFKNTLESVYTTNLNQIVVNGTIGDEVIVMIYKKTILQEEIVIANQFSFIQNFLDAFENQIFYPRVYINDVESNFTIIDKNTIAWVSLSTDIVKVELSNQPYDFDFEQYRQIVIPGANPNQIAFPNNLVKNDILTGVKIYGNGKLLNGPDHIYRKFAGVERIITMQNYSSVNDLIVRFNNEDLIVGSSIMYSALNQVDLDVWPNDIIPANADVLLVENTLIFKDYLEGNVFVENITVSDYRWNKTTEILEINNPDSVELEIDVIENQQKETVHLRYWGNNYARYNVPSKPINPAYVFVYVNGKKQMWGKDWIWNTHAIDAWDNQGWDTNNWDMGKISSIQLIPTHKTSDIIEIFIEPNNHAEMEASWGQFVNGKFSEHFSINDQNVGNVIALERDLSLTKRVQADWMREGSQYALYRTGERLEGRRIEDNGTTAVASLLTNQTQHTTNQNYIITDFVKISVQVGQDEYLVPWNENEFYVERDNLIYYNYTKTRIGNNVYVKLNTVPTSEFDLVVNKINVYDDKSFKENERVILVDSKSRLAGPVEIFKNTSWDVGFWNKFKWDDKLNGTFETSRSSVVKKIKHQNRKKL